MKKILIGILALNLLNLSCAVTQDLTAEEQAGYDIINTHFSKSSRARIYNKTFSNKPGRHTWGTVSSAVEMVEDMFSEEQFQSLMNKAENLDKMKLDPDYILNTISLYRGKRTFATKINFPIISDDGNYSILYLDYGGVEIHVYKKNGVTWEVIASKLLRTYDPVIRSRKKVPLNKHTTGKLVNN